MKNIFKEYFALALGGLLSLFCGGFISTVPDINKIELNIQDNLLKFRSFTIDPSNEIILVKLDRVGFTPEFNPNKLEVYYQIADSILDSQPKVVILNLLDEWKTLFVTEHLNYIEQENSRKKIQQLIKKNQEDIVLVNNIRNVKYIRSVDIINYNESLNLDESGEQSDDIGNPEQLDLKLITELLSFFEYDNIESEIASNLSSPARRAYVNEVIRPYDDEEISLRSFGFSIMEKYQQDNSKKKFLSSLPKYIQINYWQPGTFDNNTFKLSEICGAEKETDDLCKNNIELKQREKFRDKIVIIGFSEWKNSSEIFVKSPFGEIDIIEAQANLISSLITNSYYQTLPQQIVILFYLLSGAILAGLISYYQTPRHLLYIAIIVFIGYITLFLGFFFSGWILPIISPIFTWIIIGITSLFYIKNKQLIQENQNKKVIIAETKAINIKAKHLIKTIWSNIHQEPLQELKIAMHQIYFLPLSNKEIKSMTDRLSFVGTEIRKYLTLDLNLVLALRPELRQGLLQAIEKHLQKLTDTGKLNLQVITNLEPIKERPLNSNWIYARDEIFSFFCEAIANIAEHGQSTTQVIVNLSQKEKKCSLIIENDGKIIDNEIETGLGTKLMSEMLEYLPDASWKRVALPDGGMRVVLNWRQEF